MELQQILDAVEDEKTFLVFVEALRRDLEVSGEGWENKSIGAFLAAAHSWADDTGFGATQNLAQVSPWKRFAVFLYCGKIYE
jgi:hypothetical protein